MKVTPANFKSALAIFQSEFIGTFPHILQRIGAGLKLIKYGPKIDAFLAEVTIDGMIETNDVKALFDAEVKRGNGFISIPADFSELASYDVPPMMNVRISQADIDKFFSQTLPAVALTPVSNNTQGDLL